MLAIVFMLYISSGMCLKLLREYFILSKSTLRKLVPKRITIYPLTDEHWHRSEILVRLGNFLLLCKTIPKFPWLAMTKFNLWVALPICVSTTGAGLHIASGTLHLWMNSLRPGLGWRRKKESPEESLNDLSIFDLKATQITSTWISLVKTSHEA